MKTRRELPVMQMPAHRGPTRFHSLPLLISLPLLTLALMATPRPEEAGQEGESARGAATYEAVPETAPVTLDGQVLFRVSGITTYPAEERAKRISSSIRALAANKTFSTDQLTTRDAGEYTAFLFGTLTAWAVHDLDAAAEGVTRQLLMEIQKEKVSEAIRLYRQERAPRHLLTVSGYALAATALAILLFLLIVRIYRRLEAWLDRRYRTRIQDLKIQSFQILQAESLWGAVRGLLQTGRTLFLLVLFVVWLEYVLVLFPWTRGFARQGFEFLLAPLKVIGGGLLDALPGLLFIAVVVLLLRYALRLLRLLAAGIESGTVQFSGFDPEWSWPTYKIIRLLVIVFGVVVAYPYIPGADTAAFKGISIFLGVIFSLGSSSAIANIIAGYTMTYRRAFKVGDRVRIGETTGDVTEIRLQVTHVRSLKNEEVIIPNSEILSSHVINYSSLARKRGLILHTTVGIGYETPWRQVEAMLTIAAGRTAGVLKHPAPFVLQKSLGDFCITYELNVYTDRPEEGPKTYTALHQNILDVFNEYQIQIMTPAYESDPEQPKIVPGDKWFEAPAAGEQTRGLHEPATGSLSAQTGTAAMSPAGDLPPPVLQPAPDARRTGRTGSKRKRRQA